MQVRRIPGFRLQCLCDTRRQPHPIIGTSLRLDTREPWCARSIRLWGCVVLLLSLSGCTNVTIPLRSEDLFVTVGWYGFSARIPVTAALASRSRHEALRQWMQKHAWKGPNAKAATMSHNECRRIIEVFSSPEFASCRTREKPDIKVSQYVITADSLSHVLYFPMSEDREIIVRRLTMIMEVLDANAAETIKPVIDQFKR